MVISIGQVAVYVFIFGRIIGLFSSAPIFSSKSVNPMARAALAAWVAAVFWFMVPIDISQIPVGWGDILLNFISQIIIGLIMGFICNLVFIILQAVGEMADVQMGLSVAQSLDPTLGGMVTVVGKLGFFLAMVVFISSNGHHMLLSAIFQSFKVIPINANLANLSNPQIGLQMADLLSYFWLSAVQLAAPIMLMIFLSDFTFGIVSRVAPQVNVFMLGFQVKPSLGLVGLLLTSSLLISFIVGYPEKMGQELLLFFSYIIK